MNRVPDAINAMIAKINESGVAKVLGIEFGSVGHINIPEIPHFATGGYPEDGLFYANHNELVGKFSNGRTAVANNEQIVSGISNGVANANQNVVNAIVTMTNNIVSAVLSGSVIEIDGQAVFNTVKSQADNYSKMYNEPAF